MLQHNQNTAHTPSAGGSLWRLLQRTLALGALGVLAACGGNPTVPYDERGSGPDYNYVIGPGDTMEIFVWGNEELSTTGIVRPDGKFTTRLVEDLPASGKTSTELARDIEEAYASTCASRW